MWPLHHISSKLIPRRHDKNVEGWTSGIMYSMSNIFRKCFRTFEQGEHHGKYILPVVVQSLSAIPMKRFIYRYFDAAKDTEMFKKAYHLIDCLYDRTPLWPARVVKSIEKCDL